MPRPLVSDEFWSVVRPLLPVQRPKPKGGRPVADARACLLGILFVLKTGCAWNDLPAELGAASPATCWRRFRDWSEAGVWQAVWDLSLAKLNKQGRIDLSHAVVDSASFRAVFGGPTRDRTRRTAPRTAASTT
jgi:transposase